MRAHRHGDSLSNPNSLITRHPLLQDLVSFLFLSVIIPSLSSVIKVFVRLIQRSQIMFSTEKPIRVLLDFAP